MMSISCISEITDAESTRTLASDARLPVKLPSSFSTVIGRSGMALNEE